MLRTDADEELQEGLRSYAHEQMRAEVALAKKWTTMWEVFYGKAHQFLSTGSTETDIAHSVVEVDLEDLDDWSDAC